MTEQGELLRVLSKKFQNYLKNAEILLCRGQAEMGTGLWVCSSKTQKEEETPIGEVHSSLYEDKAFLIRLQSLTYSRIFQHFTELEVSLLCSQEPSSGPYHEPDESGPYYPWCTHMYAHFICAATWYNSEVKLILYFHTGVNRL
jgi:hypothetical protein